MDNVNLLNGFVLVKKHEPKDSSEKLEFAQAIDDFVYRGEVIKHGGSPVGSTGGLDLTGKVVYFRKDAGEELKLHGQTLKAIKIEDIICYE
jgi:hypothetical protein